MTNPGKFNWAADRGRAGAEVMLSTLNGSCNKKLKLFSVPDSLLPPFLIGDVLLELGGCRCS